MLSSSRSRKSLILIAFLIALSLVAAACGGNGGGGGVDVDQDQVEPVEGGSVVFGAEQEPLKLNGYLACCTMFWAGQVYQAVLPAAYTVMPDFSIVPEVLDGEAEITEDPFTVTYNIKEEAQWNDGTPITADDFEFSWKTFTNPKFDIADRTGYEDISKAEKIDDKTIKFTFSKPYGGYKLMFSVSQPLLPAHALEGENFNKVWANDLNNPKTGEPISGGPFMFEEWKKGESLTLVRNPEYWGEHTAYLDEIVFRFITDTNSEIEAVRGGEVDLIYPQPQLELADLLNQTGIEVQASLGTVWEHVDFQFNNPLLKQQFMREAIAHGIDRQAVVDQLVAKVKPDAEVLNNLIYVANQPEYEPHFEKWNFDPERSRQILEENGCTEGDDGIFECDGEKAEFSFTTTAGNALRELAFQIIQAQLKDVGIRLTSNIKDAGVVFTEVLPNPAKWELFMFAWVGNPDPTSSNAIWTCKGGQNYNKYCNPEVDKLMQQGASLVDPAEQAEFYNQADALMADDLPVLPLYQKPTFLAFQTRVHGLQDNPTNEGPIWNAVDWFVEGGGNE